MNNKILSSPAARAITLVVKGVCGNLKNGVADPNPKVFFCFFFWGGGWGSRIRIRIRAGTTNFDEAGPKKEQNILNRTGLKKNTKYSLK